MRWGFHEFWDLFVRNHYPILADQQRTGRLLEVRAFVPRFHGDGRADWYLMVRIRYRDWAAVEAHSDSDGGGAALLRSGAPSRRGAASLRAAGGPLGLSRSRNDRSVDGQDLVAVQPAGRGDLEPLAGAASQQRLGERRQVADPPLAR